jgi:hypothetical protein
VALAELVQVAQHKMGLIRYFLASHQQAAVQVISRQSLVAQAAQAVAVAQVLQVLVAQQVQQIKVLQVALEL